jgi:hypothetical protein
MPAYQVQFSNNTSMELHFTEGQTLRISIAKKQSISISNRTGKLTIITETPVDDYELMNRWHIVKIIPSKTETMSAAHRDPPIKCKIIDGEEVCVEDGFAITKSGLIGDRLEDF